MALAGKVLRLIAGAEFAGSLALWALGRLDWGLACILCVLTLPVALGALEGECSQP